MENPNKKTQTYAWALREMSAPWQHGGYQLRDIAKRHHTPELVRTAVLHGRAPLKLIPEEERTPEMCLVPCICNRDNLNFVPDSVLTMDFLKQVVNAAPHHYSAAFYLSRKGRESEPFSKEDVELALIALAPIQATKNMLDNLTVPAGEMSKDDMEKAAVEHFGRFALDSLPVYMVKQALEALLANFTENN